MIQPSTAVADVARTAGLGEFADAMTVDPPPACKAAVRLPERCNDALADNSSQQLIAETAALGLALFVAVMVGRIGVLFVNLFGTCLRHHRVRMAVRAAARRTQAELLDG